MLEPYVQRGLHGGPIVHQHLEIGEMQARGGTPIHGRPASASKATARWHVRIIQNCAFVHIHLFPASAGSEPLVFHHLEEEWRTRIRGGDMEERNIERQFFSEINRLTNGLFRFAGQADDESSPNS
jgi:hypothetical protein